MKIAGFCSGHDAAYGILEDGIPEIHNELERFNRIKDAEGDSMELLFNTYSGFVGEIDYYTHCIGSKREDKYKALERMTIKHEKERGFMNHIRRKEEYGHS